MCYQTHIQGNGAVAMGQQFQAICIATDGEPNTVSISYAGKSKPGTNLVNQTFQKVLQNLFHETLINCINLLGRRQMERGF